MNFLNFVRDGSEPTISQGMLGSWGALTVAPLPSPTLPKLQKRQSTSLPKYRSENSKSARTFYSHHPRSKRRADVVKEGVGGAGFSPGGLQPIEGGCTGSKKRRKRKLWLVGKGAWGEMLVAYHSLARGGGVICMSIFSFLILHRFFSCTLPINKTHVFLERAESLGLSRSQFRVVGSCALLLKFWLRKKSPSRSSLLSILYTYPAIIGIPPRNKLNPS